MESLHSEADTDFSDNSSQVHIFGSGPQKQAAAELRKILDSLEENISTYHVYRDGNRQTPQNTKKIYDEADDIYLNNNDGYMSSFTSTLLKKIKPQISIEDKMSLRQLMELEKKPWEYCELFDIDLTTNSDNESDS